MSYHNGSIWPHDNALIALGLGRYGFKRAAGAIFAGLFDAAGHMDLMRFPELFCGFPRRRGAAPTLYPVACAPQALGQRRALRAAGSLPRHCLRSSAPGDPLPQSGAAALS